MTNHIIGNDLYNLYEDNYDKVLLLWSLLNYYRNNALFFSEITITQLLLDQFAQHLVNNICLKNRTTTTTPIPIRHHFKFRFSHFAKDKSGTNGAARIKLSPTWTFNVCKFSFKNVEILLYIFKHLNMGTKKRWLTLHGTYLSNCGICGK